MGRPDGRAAKAVGGREAGLEFWSAPEVRKLRWKLAFQGPRLAGARDVGLSEARALELESENAKWRETQVRIGQ